MININTTWDREVLDALTDAQAVNFFTSNDVNTSWTTINQRRHSLLGGTATNNQPFMSFATWGPDDPMAPPTPEFPTRRGFAGTFVAGDFQNASGGTHPYVREEMLTKVVNHMTTRSNVFAVYLTVGFFEVIDDTTRPVRLGAEIRARNGLPIRHKMFAIVDRTQLGLDPADTLNTNAGVTQGGIESNLPGQPAKAQFFVTSEDAVTAESFGTTNPSSYPLRLNIVGGMAQTMRYDGQNITLPAQFRLYADVGTQQEVLEGCSINAAGQLEVPLPGFRKTHAAGFSLSYLRPGNPGPQPAFDISNTSNNSRYNQVVPYHVIIQ
jgi:hypothetical protein